MNKIPTDEEFERASKLMEERSRYLDKVRSIFFKHFKKKCPLYDFCILSQRDVNFRSYIFF